jgi:hypothetical protein
MATALKNLTKMGTDVKQIARLLQKKAPPGHMLAYISPEEAEVLKQRGGSGRITDAGIPSFEETTALSPESFAAPPGEASYTPPVGGGSYAPISDNINIQQPLSAESFAAPPGEASYTPPAGQAAFAQLADFNVPSATQISPVYTGGAAALTPQELALSQTQGPPGEASYTPPSGQTAFQQLPDTGKAPGGMSDQTKARLGISGLEALIGASTARAARAQGQQAQQALQAQAAPYQQKGQELLAATQRGELTPANQQILQAQQAQAAQNVATRGGVGGMQAQNQINALTQQLLQSQLNLGLQLESVGDKIAQGAIQAGVQADQYVNNLTSSYAMNVARTLAGGLPGGTTATAPPPQA